MSKGFHFSGVHLLSFDKPGMWIIFFLYFILVFLFIFNRVMIWLDSLYFSYFCYLYGGLVLGGLNLQGTSSPIVLRYVY